ncbi:MAG: hypothetical protein DRH03_08330, partial [Deltaproteobacteria bacterium]
ILYIAVKSDAKPNSSIGTIAAKTIFLLIFSFINASQQKILTPDVDVVHKEVTIAKHFLGKIRKIFCKSLKKQLTYFPNVTNNY